MRYLARRHSRTKSDSSTLSVHETHLKISNYNFHDIIGEGAYCKVRIVQNKTTRKYYALKYIPKSQPTSKLRTITQERNILSTVNHPFLCNLKYAFQDPQFLYMVLELMQGGDLRYYLKRYVLSEHAIRVIISELSCAVEYLHDNGIVHRDIKPENIVLDCDGHVHLGDFNVAKRLSCDASVIKGVSGTFSYMAPEMHQGLPYTEMVDWWAIGVVFYESVYGRVPFKARNRDHTHMLKLMSVGAAYPEITREVSDECIRAIKRFLIGYPYERVKDCYTLFQLDFFREMRSRDLLELCTPGTRQSPVFIPSNVRFNYSSKIDREKALAFDASHWKKSRDHNQKRGQQKGVEPNKNNNTQENNQPMSRLRRYSSVVNKYLSTLKQVASAEPGALDEKKENREPTTEFKFRVDFGTYNCDGEVCHIVARSPASITVNTNSTSNSTTYCDKAGPFPSTKTNTDTKTLPWVDRPSMLKRDSLFLPSSLKHPSRLQKRKSINFRAIPSKHVPIDSLPEGVVSLK